MKTDFDLSTLPPDVYYSFHGIAYNSNDTDEFKLGDLVFQAVCNPYDGYRSALDKVQLLDKTSNKFFDNPLDLVSVSFDGDFYYLKSQDGHIWLTFGTNYENRHYFYYTFDYTPKEDAQPSYSKQCHLDLNPECFI